MKHLFIVAHYDDEAFAFSGALSKLYDNSKAILYLAQRVTNHLPDKHKRVLLRDSANKVCSLLGARPIFAEGLDDEHLTGDNFLRVIDAIEGALDLEKPDIVWTHWDKDFNQDHRAVSEATEIATRRLHHRISKLIHFEVPSATEFSLRHFEPNSFWELCVDDVERKKQAINYYVSEFSEYRNYNVAKAYMKFRGLPVVLENAEAFKLVRERI